MKREVIKPFSWGLIAGGIAITIVAFSAGWVTTSGTRDLQVRAAWIDGQAAVCYSLVQAHRQASGDVTDISGHQARAARDELANTFAVALQGQETADSRVIKACSDLLDRSNA